MTEADPNQESDPKELDPEYEHHGGFPAYGPAEPGAGFRRFVETMRRVQDLAVSADPDGGVWDKAAEHAAALVELLGPFQAAEEGKAPAGRTPDLPGMGSLLLPPWTLTRYAPDGVEMTGHFSRFHVGGNHAVHGGVLPLLFDHLFGMIVHAAGRPISRTAFLHVDYRNVTPIDVPLAVRGRVTRVEGRKAFVGAELVDGGDGGQVLVDGGQVLAQANGLMVRLLPGQP
ncbi:MAG: PaaI family thioesterase [Mycobacterium sp.]|uniref:PaaI family thioesterase n=1 Tax=Mycobacterium sp. TaxID=1785 RepID=UPI001EC2D950|nr:PaaI family thioesterase [Mycobacterium sp.]MBW0019655.1 PaaI family thioesterase [Mycobacterium sp.]